VIEPTTMLRRTGPGRSRLARFVGSVGREREPKTFDHRRIGRMRLVLQLQVPADARMLPKTRQAVAGYLEEAETTAEVVDDVVLALDEACANVIRHAFPNGVEGDIHLRADIDEQSITVLVEDDGVGFDPFQVDLRSRLDDTSGRGLHLIRMLMSSVDVESPTETGVGTRLRMRKQLDH
jgi:anti-sigma regulatory factor (Ser/Thr protein kinase)